MVEKVAVHNMWCKYSKTCQQWKSCGTCKRDVNRHPKCFFIQILLQIVEILSNVIIAKKCRLNRFRDFQKPEEFSFPNSPFNLCTMSIADDWMIFVPLNNIDCNQKSCILRLSSTWLLYIWIGVKYTKVAVCSKCLLCAHVLVVHSMCANIIIVKYSKDLLVHILWASSQHFDNKQRILPKIRLQNNRRHSNCWSLLCRSGVMKRKNHSYVSECS